MSSNDHPLEAVKLTFLIHPLLCWDGKPSFHYKQAPSDSRRKQHFWVITPKLCLLLGNRAHLRLWESIPPKTVSSWMQSLFSFYWHIVQDLVSIWATVSNTPVPKWEVRKEFFNSRTKDCRLHQPQISHSCGATSYYPAGAHAAFKAKLCYDMKTERRTAIQVFNSSQQSAWMLSAF